MNEAVLLALAVAVGINLVLFLVAYSIKSDKLTDISYAISFLAVDSFGLYYAPRRNTFSYLLIGLIALWALRIGCFLLLRVMKTGKDRRFDKIRQNFIKFGRFWAGQAVTSWILMLPVVLAEYRSGKIGLAVYIGGAIWLAGFAIESVADYQKYIFKQSKHNSNKWIGSGLWRFSRHPNYFGEILIWVGIYVFCLSALSPVLKIVCLCSPVLISLLLVFVSGIPPLEKSADLRWGESEEYQAYKARTRALVPWIGSK